MKKCQVGNYRTVVAKCKASNVIYWPLCMCICVSSKELCAVYEAVHLYVCICNNVVCKYRQLLHKIYIFKQHLRWHWIYTCLSESNSEESKFSALILTLFWVHWAGNWHMLSVQVNLPVPLLFKAWYECNFPFHHKDDQAALLLCVLGQHALFWSKTASMIFLGIKKIIST